MRKSTLFLAAGLAIVFAAVATFLIMNYMKAHIAKSNAEMVPVVVAVQDLTYGNVLKPEQMKTVDYPANSLPKGYYSSPDSLFGEVTKVFVMENEPIIANKLSSAGGGLSLKVPDSMRAASISVDKVSGVSGFVLPGDRVDVIASLDNYGNKKEAIATTVLQNIEVLAAGEKTEQQSDKNVQVQSVTLLVNSAGAQTLALASKKARMSLSLRNPNDIDTMAIASVTAEQIFEGKKKKDAPKVVYVKAPEPKKDAPKEEPKPVDNSVKIYRGSTEKTTTPPLTPGAAEPTKTTPN